MNNYTFTLIGQSAVGKSQFCDYFKTRVPYKMLAISDSVELNIEFEYKDCLVRITDERTLKTDGLILMFDVSKPSTLDYLQEYLTLNVPKILVGNKCDLLKLEENEPSWYCDKVRDLLKNKKINKYYDISALSYYNIDKPFNSLIEFLVL